MRTVAIVHNCERRRRARHIRVLVIVLLARSAECPFSSAHHRTHTPRRVFRQTIACEACSPVRLESLFQLPSCSCFATSITRRPTRSVSCPHRIGRSATSLDTGDSTHGDAGPGQFSPACALLCPCCTIITPGDNSTDHNTTTCLILGENRCSRQMSTRMQAAIGKSSRLRLVEWR